MNKQELTELLSEMAVRDLAEGSKLSDHPCSVAIKALDKCFDDIKFLRKIANNPGTYGKSKRGQMILGLNYNPAW